MYSFKTTLSVSAHENTHLVNAHKSRVYIAVFGIGGTLFFSCTVINRALQTQVLSLLYDCAMLLCFTVYVTAIYGYYGARLKNTAIFHYGIAFLIGANAWTWILITVYPLYDALHWNVSAYNISARNVTGDAFSTPDSVHIFGILEGLFQPFFIEFLTISSGCLLSLWQAMRYGSRYSVIRRSVTLRPSSEEYINHNYNDILLSENAEVQLDPEQRSISEKRKIYIVTTISILAAGTYLIAVQMLSEGPFGKCTDHLEIKTCATYRKIMENLYLFSVGYNEHDFPFQITQR